MYCLLSTVPHRTVSLEVARPKIETTTRFNSQVDSISSREILQLINMVDSLNKEVFVMKDQHNHALDDLRQETN